MAFKGTNYLNIELDFDTLSVDSLDKAFAENEEKIFNDLCKRNHITDKSSQDAILLRTQIQQVFQNAKEQLSSELRGDTFLRQVNLLTSQASKESRKEQREAAKRGKDDSALGHIIREMDSRLSSVGAQLVYGMRIGTKGGKPNVDFMVIPASMEEAQNKETRRQLAFSQEALTFSVSADTYVLDRTGHHAQAKQLYLGTGAGDESNLYNRNQMKAKKVHSSMTDKLVAAAMAKYNSAKLAKDRASALEEMRHSFHKAAEMNAPALTKSDVTEEEKDKNHSAKTYQNIIRGGQTGLLEWTYDIVDFLSDANKKGSKEKLKANREYLFDTQRASQDLMKEYMLGVLSEKDLGKRRKAATRLAKSWGNKFGLSKEDTARLSKRLETASVAIGEGSFANANDAVLRTGNYTGVDRHVVDPTGFMNPTERSSMQRENFARVKIAAKGGHAQKVKGTGLETQTMIEARHEDSNPDAHVYVNSIATSSKILNDILKNEVGLSDEQIASMGHLEEGGIYLSPTRMQDQYIDTGDVQITQQEIKDWQKRHRSNKQGAKWDRKTAIRALAMAKIAGSNKNTVLNFEDPGAKSGEGVTVAWENPYSLDQGSKAVTNVGLGGGRYTVNKPLTQKQWKRLLAGLQKRGYTFQGDVDMITTAPKEAGLNDIDALVRGQINATHAFLSEKDDGPLESFRKFKSTLRDQFKAAGFSDKQAEELSDIYTFDPATGQIMMQGDKWVFEKAAEFADPTKTGVFADPTKLAELAQTRFALAASQFAKDAGMVSGDFLTLNAEGGLDVNLFHYKGRGEFAAIDQPLMDQASHSGRADIKETPQTLSALAYTIGVAEMITGKKLTKLRMGVEALKKRTPEEEARIEQVEGNLEETLSRYKLGLSESDVRIDQTLIRDKNLKHNFERTADTGKITRKSFDESLLGAIAKSANGQHAYIDIAGHKIPLPRMDDIAWVQDENTHEEVMERTPEWFTPVTHLLNYLSYVAPAQLTSENLERKEKEYQTEYARNVKSKERAFYEEGVKTYGGPDAYLKVVSAYGDLFAEAQTDEETRRRLDSAAIMNLKDLENMLKRGPMGQESRAEYNEALKELAEHQIEGIFGDKGREDATKYLAEVSAKFANGEIAEDTYTAKLAQIIARTGNRKDEWFNKKGIVGLSTLRYPENLGFLKNATATYTLGGNELKEGVLQLGVALQEWEHADFDGDKMKQDLIMISAALKSLGVSYKEFYDELDELVDAMAKVREPTGKAKREDYQKQNEVVKDENQNPISLPSSISQSDLALLRDEDELSAPLTALMKEQKDKTGFETVKSANFQEVQHQLLGVTADSTPEQKARWVASVAVNELLSATPQYGISAKKILRNLRESGGDKQYRDEQGHIDIKRYMADLRRFYNDYDNPEAWADADKRALMFERGAQLGVFGSKKGTEDAFDARSLGAVFGFAKSLTGTDEEKLNIIKEAFGLDLANEEENNFAKGLLAGEAPGISMKYLFRGFDKVQSAIKGQSVFGPDGQLIKLEEGLKTLFSAGVSLAPGSDPTINKYVRSLTGGNNSIAGSASTSMERAAQNLNDAAQALLKLAESGGFGGIGGGGGRGPKPLPSWNRAQHEALVKDMETELNMRVTREQDAEEANKMIEEKLAKGEDIPDELLKAAQGKAPHNYTSVSRYLSFLDPKLNTDESGFIKAVKEGSPENNFGYRNKKDLDTLRENYFTHAQGTISGALVQLYHLAKGAGLDVTDMENANKMTEDGQGRNIVESLFGRIREAGTSSTASAEAKKLYKDIFEDDEYGIFALYRDGMELIGKMFSDNPAEVQKRFGTIFGLTAGQNLQTSVIAGKGAKLLGTETEVRGKIGGDYFGGRGDLMFSSVNEEGKRVVTLVDTKNPNKGLSEHNIAQQLMYLRALREERSYIQQRALEKDEEGNVVSRMDFDEFAKENATFVNTLGMTRERYEAMRDSDEVNVYISGLSRRAESIALKMEASEDLLNSILAGFKAIKDGVAGGKDVSSAVNALAKTLTDPQLFKHSIFEGEDMESAKKKILNWAKADGIAGASDDEMLARGKTPASLKGYESLVRQRARLLTKIYSNQRSVDTTFDRREKAALESELEVLTEQNAQLEEQIELEKQNAIALGVTEEQIGIIDKRTADFLDREVARVNVMKRGKFNLWDALSSSLQGVMNRFTQMGLAYTLLNKLKKGFGEVIQSAQQLDKAMVNLRVVTGASYEEARSMVHGYAQLGKELAATTLEVSTAAQEWLRQGYDVAQVNKLVESSIKLSVLGMMSASDATKALTSAMKGFKMEAGDVSEIVDKFTSLDMKAATTAGDIATALSKFATTAQMAGVDIDQAAAMATTIMDVSQNDAGATGNALKTIFSRFGNVKAGAYQKMSAGDSDDTTEKLNDIERVLSTLGIQIRSSSREMRDFDDVLDEVAEKWQYLDSVSQNAIATALAGTRQRESFAVLMNNYDKYKEFIEVSRNSAGTADKKYQSYLDQLEASQKRLKAAWEDIANSTEIAGIVTFWNNFLSNVVSALPTIIRYVTKLAVTLNSYKIPSILSQIFGISDGWTKKGKHWLYGATSLGLVERAEKYKGRDGGFHFDNIINGPARRVASAFNMVADSVEKATKKEKASGGITIVGSGAAGKKTAGQKIVTDGVSITFKTTHANQKKVRKNDIPVSGVTSDSPEYGGSVSPQSPFLDSAPKPKLKKKKTKGKKTQLVVTGEYQPFLPKVQVNDTPSESYDPGFPRKFRTWHGIETEMSPTTPTTYVSPWASHSFAGEESPVMGVLRSEKRVKKATGLSPKFKFKMGTKTVREGKNVYRGGKTLPISLPEPYEGGDIPDYNIPEEYVPGTKKIKAGNYFKPTKQGAGMAAVGGLTSAAMSAVMGNQGINYSTGQMQQASSEANTVATLNSTLSNVGYIWGPMVGQAANLVADMLNKYLIIPLIDKEANERKARVEHANKLYDQLTGLADNVASLKDYAAKTTLTNEESVEMTNKVYDMLAEYYGMDTDSQGEITKYLLPYLKAAGLGEFSTFYDVMQAYLKGDSKTKQALANAVQYAEQRSSLEQSLAKNEEKAHQTSEDIKNLTKYNLVSNWWNNFWTASVEDFHRGNLSQGSYTKLMDVASQLGYVGENGLDRYIDSESMSYDLHEYTEMIEAVLRNLDETQSEEIKKYTELLRKVQDLAALRKTEMDAYNKQAATNALLITKISDTGGYLLDQTSDQLKYLGTDKIMRLVAETIAEKGGFSGEAVYVNNNKRNGLTTYAQDIVMQAIKENPTLAAIVTGASYSISDLRKDNGLYDWDQRKKEYDSWISSFAAALHMTYDEFKEKLDNGELVDKLGNMTLGDFLKTPEELRQSMENLSSLFHSLADNTFLTAENLEKIINDYPTLIKYLGDTSNLMEAMINSLSEYAQVYATKIYDQLISSTPYADQLKKELYESGEYDTEALRKAIGDAPTVKEIIGVLKKGPEELGLSQADYDKIVEKLTHLFDNIPIDEIFMRQLATEDIMPYIEMKLDRQLEALNKQKEALQQINKQREYENKLIEARNKLEEAGKEKKKVWREGVGWVFEADQDAIAEAQKNLQEVEDDRQVRELDIMIDQINAEKELLKAIQDDAKFKALEKSMEALLGEGATDKGINGLIRMAEKLYNGDTGVLSSVPGIGKTLEDLDKSLAQMIKGQFAEEMREYDVSKLMELASVKNEDASQREAAQAELKRRGYYYYEGKEGKVQYWDLPTGNVTQQTIDNAIAAYDTALNKKQIAEWLQDQGYESYQVDGKTKWRQAKQVYFVYDKNYGPATGDWEQSNTALSKDSSYYRAIQSDFEAGQAAYYTRRPGTNSFNWKEDIKPEDYFNDFDAWKQEHEGAIINGYGGNAELAIVLGGNLYGLKRAAQGSLGLPGGPALVNELGTEAIVTPYGTVTSLPSGTGVVPADITKNLWELGEVAPALSRLLDPMVRKGGDAVLGDSFSVQNMVVNMNPDGSFDVDSFLNELKSAIALRKNS